MGNLPRIQAGLYFIFSEKVTWWFFVAVSIHLAFLYPFATLIPGERANLFSGLLCAIAFVAALVLGRTDNARPLRSEISASIVLAALVVLSCCFSLSPRLSWPRGFVILSSALGGYWCSRILLAANERQEAFKWISVAIFIALLALGIRSWIAFGHIYGFVDFHWHPVTSRILILSFAPMALIATASSRAVRFLGGFLLAVSYVVLLIGKQTSGMESAAVIPVIMLLLAACFLRWRPAFVIPVVLVLFVISMLAGNYYPHHVEKKFMSISYRTENIFFSWEIAKAFPLMGIGLWAPRNVILDNYQTHYPSLSKETFVEWTEDLRTSENTFLTFLADLGIPFTALYLGVLLVLWIRLLGRVCTQPRGPSIPPLVLFLPITGALLQFQIVDALFHPQIWWFFHVLLGLIPPVATCPPVSSGVVKSSVGKGLVLVGVAALGILLGSSLPRWDLLGSFVP
jgi:hypothetical protein